ncbi:MAG TPA: MarR family transcriptional regulator [Thermoanaerobaculia bacterium]|jgi:DNA-binding MarR family transcriptional regulator
MVSGLQRELKQNRPFGAPTQEAAVALMRTADLVRRAMAAVVEPLDLTVQQYHVLRILRDAGERGLPTLDIAGRMIEQTPGITRLVDRLEAKQLVARERCATDRRQVFCRVTPEGLALLGKLDRPIREAEQDGVRELSESQLARLMTLLDRARTGMQTPQEIA